MPDRCPKCLLPLATQADYDREHPDECDVQAGTGDSCWCGALCWNDEWTCGGDRGAARSAAAIRLARALSDNLEASRAPSYKCESPYPHDHGRCERWEFVLDALAAFRELDAGNGAG